jgi:pimeloyl-ACP methyl ester carboxylesterase
MTPRPTPPRAGARSLVFVHANGFTAGSYGVLFDLWRARGWRVIAPERLGHDAAYPVTSGWHRLRDELLAFVRRARPAAQVVMVGHSMGGYLALLAASAAPALVSAVVLLDAPIVAGWRSHGFRLLKLTGLIRRGGPGKVSVRRRDHWPDLDAARAHFAARMPFAAWDPRCFERFVQHGLERARGGDVRLAFHRDVETRIYNTLPHHLQPLLRRHPLRCPVAYVHGTRSLEARQLGLGFVQQLAAARWRTIEGSHLFPFEQPDATAAAVDGLLTAMATRDAHL